MNWKRASEITEPGGYWVDDRRPESLLFGRLFVVSIFEDLKGMLRSLHYSPYKENRCLSMWPDSIYLAGPIEPPEVEGKENE